jgi:hypothetical protein
MKTKLNRKGTVKDKERTKYVIETTNWIIEMRTAGCRILHDG